MKHCSQPSTESHQWSFTRTPQFTGLYLHQKVDTSELSGLVWTKLYSVLKDNMNSRMHTTQPLCDLDLQEAKVTR